MSNSKLALGTFGVVLASAVSLLAFAPASFAQPEKPPATAGAVAHSAAMELKCKQHNGKTCCDPSLAGHLPLAAIFSACGESDATFLGEEGSKETCKYVFKVEGQKEEDTFVQVYAPAQKEVPSEPNDPFFSWKRVGKVFMTEKAKSPKAAPMMVNSTGLWLPGKGYFVSVNASTKVCDKAQAKKLAPSIK